MKNKLDSLLFHKANIVRFTILCRSATNSKRTYGSLCTRAKKNTFYSLLSCFLPVPPPLRFGMEVNMAVIEITAENFEQEVMQSEKPVLLDFWAVWCGPCQMLSPLVDEVAEEREDIKVGKINVDEQQELAMKYQVMSIPMLLVVKNGEITNRSVGLISKDQILGLL